MNTNNEALALGALCSTLNQIAEDQTPESAKLMRTAVAPELPPLQPLPVDIRSMKIAFTGRLKSGKDYLAGQIGATVFGLADPLYRLLEHFFETTDKDAHGARAFLQTVGQWGRGLVNAGYPLTAERATFVTLIRTLAARGVFPANLLVDWKSYGSNPNIWLDSCLLRTSRYLESHSGARVAVTNVRFENELAAMKAAGWSVFHVTCSPETWSERLVKAGHSPSSAVTTNESEQLAAAIDMDVRRKISLGGKGGKLRCIWCDDKVAAPSPRLFTVKEFVARML